MKARGIFVSLLISLICVFLLIGGCSGDGGSNGPSSAKAITAYSLNGVAGTINEAGKTIAVTMPSLTNVFSLVATFTTTGTSVTIGTNQQVSGTTANDFTTPLTYTVTAADGTTTTYTVTITVNRAWHNPTSLSDNISPNGQNGFSHHVAMDSNGNAIIVWCQSDGVNLQIFKSEYRSGVWHHPVSLSDNISIDGWDAQTPRVAMDNNGNAIIVWEQPDGGHPGGAAFSQIYKSEYRNGAWTHPASLSDHISPGGTPAGKPQVAMDNNGSAIIVWYQYDSDNNFQIFKSEYRNGSWTNPASLTDNNSPDGSSAYYPNVAMGNNGNAIIVWHQSNGTNEQIFKSEYRGGVWDHPSSLSDYISPNGQDAYNPQVAMDNNGNAIIVWYQHDESNIYQIFKSEYRDGLWHYPSSLSDHISPDGQHAWYPQVAMDSNGNAIIVWYQSDGTNLQIFKSEYREGAWHNSASLSSNTSTARQQLVAKEGVTIIFDSVIISPNGQDATFPQVAMDNKGNAIIVWSQSDGAVYQIFKSEYRNGAWINPSSLADNISPDGQSAFYPQVAMDNNGNAIIVWYQPDGAVYQIFKSEYR